MLVYMRVHRPFVVDRWICELLSRIHSEKGQRADGTIGVLRQATSEHHSSRSLSEALESSSSDSPRERFARCVFSRSEKSIADRCCVSSVDKHVLVKCVWGTFCVAPCTHTWDEIVRSIQWTSRLEKLQGKTGVQSYLQIPSGASETWTRPESEASRPRGPWCMYHHFALCCECFPWTLLLKAEVIFIRCMQISGLHPKMQCPPILPSLVKAKLITSPKALRSLEQEEDSFDEYNGVMLTYKDKLRKVASKVGNLLLTYE